MDAYGLKKILVGSSSYIPGMLTLRKKLAGSCGSSSARYCYSVWLRHLIKTRALGLVAGPKVLAELGPGSSLGVGLAALLSGCEKYWAFDVERYEDLSFNMHIFDELVELFRSRAPLPDDVEFPDLKPRLASYDFPRGLLTDGILVEALSTERVHSLRQLVRELIEGTSHAASTNGCEIRCIVPWHGDVGVLRGHADMVISQAVMEHVEDVKGAYEATFEWLVPGGIASHRIDFRSHGCAKLWNGHWAYSRFAWRLMKGNKPFMINRIPYSWHLSRMKQSGFEILSSEADYVPASSGIAREQLVREFANLTDEDMTTSGAYIVARRPVGNREHAEGRSVGNSGGSAGDA